mmetsp:Transcript_101991/g.295120  ORF Transcript_101991/g.295120 Transcript_101991/m.295120 type:complete len:217 (+) Transcript_101991:1398-2048(+)
MSGRKGCVRNMANLMASSPSSSKKRHRWCFGGDANSVRLYSLLGTTAQPRSLFLALSIWQILSCGPTDHVARLSDSRSALKGPICLCFGDPTASHARYLSFCWSQAKCPGLLTQPSMDNSGLNGDTTEPLLLPVPSKEPSTSTKKACWVPSSSACTLSSKFSRPDGSAEDNQRTLLKNWGTGAWTACGCNTTAAAVEPQSLPLKWPKVTPSKWPSE